MYSSMISEPNLQEIDSHDCLSKNREDYWQQEEGSCNHQMQCRSEFCMHEEYKDLYEIKNHKRQHEVCHENLMDKRMALVHQKFILAKRLANNKRFIQSKEFKDALEVLSSNRDLFLKFLEEPNSLFSKQLNEIQQMISLKSHSKRITILKPTAYFDSDHEKRARKNRRACGEEISRNIDVHGRCSSLFIPKAKTTSQSTKIVVLKPSPIVLHETKTNMTSRNLRMDDDIGSREVAMKIAWQKQKDLRSMQKDEYPSTVFSSNLYLADEGTLNRSENDCREERSSDCSDSELVIPTSQNLWAHLSSINPGSVNSFSHQSHSVRSATSNAISHEEAYIKKKSSTLGEMLAIPEAKKEEEVVDRLAISSWVSSIEGTSNITSLKSLPDSECHENIRENEEIFCTLSSNSGLLKGVSKSMKGKSFKEKVSSLFFSRMKKKPSLSTSLSSDGRIHVASSSIKDNNQLDSSHEAIFDDDTSKYSAENLFECSSPPISVNRVERHEKVSFKGIRSIEKLWKSEISRGHFNQHSPISVHERPLQEEFSINITHFSQHAIITSCTEAPCRLPLIGLVRSSTYSEKAHSISITPNSLKLSKLFSKEDEEQEQLDFVQKLISTSNLANERSNTVLAKSHSLDCPLDPVLLDELLERGEEAKYREKRLNQKLLFDYVIDVLKEIGYCNLAYAYPWSTTTIMAQSKTNPTVTDAVLCLLKDCFAEEEKRMAAENNKQFVDSLVRKEVIRSGLDESMWLEIDEFSKEIGEKMLEELFDDALDDLIRYYLC